MKFQWKFVLILLGLIGPKQVYASAHDSIEAKTVKPLKFSASGQIWLRYTELNPGSQIDDLAETVVTDLSIRRFRMALSGDLSDRIYVKIQMGLNNFNDLSKNSEIRLLDLLAVYKVSDYLYVGMGKNGYTGPSRYASVASGAMLGVDIPIFALSTINISDDFLRKLGVFVKGEVNQLAYRLILAKPNRVEKPAQVQEIANFAAGNPQWQTSGYLKYQFFEKENLTSAYMPGTYYGTKKVLNVGVGFLTQDRAMSNLILADTTYYRMNQWALDVFADLPIGSGNQAMTLYAAYFHTDFGPGYIRMIGANNPASGSDGQSLNGAGNRYPSIGTGQVIYSQLGYLFKLPGNLQKIGSLQPYFHIQHADYEQLSEPMRFYEAGLNLLLDGHRSKLTLGWQNWPVYSANGDKHVTDRKSSFVIQYQFKL